MPRLALLLALAACQQGLPAKPRVDEGALTQDHTQMPAPLPEGEALAALPPDGGPEFNRLVFEASPYLRQHARNPVDWYPWGEEAFRVAAERDVPVFLSIGYSTCHWCHVMERESFEDADVARLMNDTFVCVKVDREERPDVDHVYMTVTQALTGSGGWPMTVLLTAERRPFFAATYLPKSSRAGRTGMLDFVPMVEKAWRDDRARLMESAEALTKDLAGRVTGAPGPDLDDATLAAAQAQLAATFDAARGGFGASRKFPVPHEQRFLLRRHARTGDTAALAMVERTLLAWRSGGLFDHVGFGVHRYSTDPEWRLPHFEKMLYDQALVTLAYVEAWQVTGRAEHERVAREILDYVARKLSAPEGGFYSAEDADSEGEEGRFYVWSLAELTDVLGAEDAALVGRLFGCTEEGNFDEEATGARTGRNVLYLPRSLAESAAQLGLAPEALAARWEALRARLFEARERRVPPLLDDKVLTDWNGLMIAAFAAAGRAFDDPGLVARAVRAADFCLRELRDEDGRLVKRWRRGDAALPGLLDDYAFLVHGLLELHQADQDPRWLQAALELNAKQIERFWDPDAGGFFLAPLDGEQLIVRGKEVYDGALPSGNSVAVHNLVRLARLTGDAQLEELAAQTIRAFSAAVRQQPTAHTQLLAGVDALLGPSIELVVVGARAADERRAALRAFGRLFAPSAVVLARDERDAAQLSALAPYTEPLSAIDGKTTYYLCTGFACEAPTHDLERLLVAARAKQRR